MEFFKGDWSYLFKTESYWYGLHTYLILHAFEGDYRYSILISGLLLLSLILLCVFYQAKNKHYFNATLILLFSCIYIFPSNIVQYEWPLVFTAYGHHIFFAILLSLSFGHLVTKPNTLAIVACLIATLFAYSVTERNLTLIAPIVGIAFLCLFSKKLKVVILVAVVVSFFTIYPAIYDANLTPINLLTKVAERFVSIYGFNPPRIWLGSFVLVAITGVGIYNLIYGRNLTSTILFFSLLFSILLASEVRGGVQPRYLLLIKGTLLAGVYSVFASKCKSNKFDVLSTVKTSLVVVVILFILPALWINSNKLENWYYQHIKPQRESHFLATFLRQQSNDVVGDFSVRQFTGGKIADRYNIHKPVIQFLYEYQFNIFRTDHFNSKHIKNHNYISGIWSNLPAPETQLVIQNNRCVTYSTNKFPSAVEFNTSNLAKRGQHIEIKSQYKFRQYYPAPLGNAKYFGYLPENSDYKICFVNRPSSIKASLTFKLIEK
jgi:hypothetical protein